MTLQAKPGGYLGFVTLEHLSEDIKID